MCACVGGGEGGGGKFILNSIPILVQFNFILKEIILLFIFLDGIYGVNGESMNQLILWSFGNSGFYCKIILQF